MKKLLLLIMLIVCCSFAYSLPLIENQTTIAFASQYWLNTKDRYCQSFQPPLDVGNFTYEMFTDNSGSGGNSNCWVTLWSGSNAVNKDAILSESIENRTCNSLNSVNVWNWTFADGITLETSKFYFVCSSTSSTGAFDVRINVNDLGGYTNGTYSNEPPEAAVATWDAWFKYFGTNASLPGVPVTITASTINTTKQTLPPINTDDLLGFCEGTTSVNSSLGYIWNWFKNDIFYSFGSGNGGENISNFVFTDDSEWIEFNVSGVFSSAAYYNYTNFNTNGSIEYLSTDLGSKINVSNSDCFTPGLKLQIFQTQAGIGPGAINCWSYVTNQFEELFWGAQGGSFVGIWRPELLSNTSFASGESVNLNNISSSETTIGDNFTFSCQAFLGVNSTEFLNSSTQQIFNIQVDNCTTFTNPILNFTYFDNIGAFPIAPEHGYNLNFILDGNSVNQQSVFNNRFSNSFCTNYNVTEPSINISITGSMQLQKDGYATRAFDITQIVPSIGTNKQSLNISLTMIALNQSTTITYTILTTSFQPIAGTLLIYECAIDDSRTLISSVPITNGLAVENIQLVNTLYSYEIITGGEVFTDFNDYSKCHVEATDTRRILVEVLPIDFTPESGFISIPCNMTKATDNTFTMVWGTNVFDNSTITGCMTQSRLTFGTYIDVLTICNVNGSINRTIPDSGFSYLISGQIFQSGLATGCPGSPLSFKSDNSTTDTFGLLGLFGVIIFVVSMMLIFTGKGAKQFIGITVGLICCFFLGIVAFSWDVIAGMLLLMLTVAWIGRRSKK